MDRLKRQGSLLGSKAGSSPSLRWWKSLPFRLAVAINLAAVAVLGAFWVLDYRRARESYLQVEAGRLVEEAQVLRAAQAQLTHAGQFQQFLDTFCRQMGVAASPGHHIAVFDARGELVARAHERANAALERRMEGMRAKSETFLHDGELYLGAQVPSAGGTRVAVAQSLAPIEEIIRAQALSRAASLGLLAVLVFGVTTVMLLFWVRDPLRKLVSAVRALGGGRFDVRVRPAGAAELRYLAEGFNEMARALGDVERQRAAQLRRARAIQTRLLPDGEKRRGPYEIEALFQPAESVGGDLYDTIELADGSTLLVVLDVSGHGMAAALYTALLRTVLRYEVKGTSDPARIVEVMNTEFGTVAGGSGEFATCFLARLEHATGSLEYVGAGHDPAVVVRVDGARELLHGRGLPVGLEESGDYAVSRAVLRPGDRLFLYTDGLHEAHNDEGVAFGRARLVELLAKTRDRTPKEQLEEVVRTVGAYAGESGFRDDVTLLCALYSERHFGHAGTSAR